AQMRNGIVVWVTVVALISNVIFNLTMHSQLGALALGLGTSLQGLVLLTGTVVALRLGLHIKRPAICMAAGARIFLLAGSLVPMLNGERHQLLSALLVSTIYWAVWVSSIPFTRGML